MIDGVMATADLEQVDCPACGPAPTKVWMTGRYPMRYLRCRKCGTIFASPRASRASRLAQLHASYEFGPRVLSFTATRRAALRYEGQIMRSLRPRGRLLDVGCCTGDLFASFIGGDWELCGVELSPSAAAVARENYGARVHTGTLRTAHFQDHYFTLVTMIDLLYYVDDLYADLLEVARIIHPRGLLGIELPGLSYMLTRSRGPLCLLLDGRWTRVSPDSHYLQWLSQVGLQRLLERTGFRVIHWEPAPASERTDAARLLSRAYNMIIMQASRMWPGLLAWAPKYLCLAEPVGRGA